MRIYHITEKMTWETERHSSEYRGDSLAVNRFIHCCTPEQVEGVLKNWFVGRQDLILLEIETDKLNSAVKYENLEGGDELFPHVYGPIGLDAIISEKKFYQRELILKSNLENIAIRELKIKVFDQWDKNWFLLTSGDFHENKFNAMTIAWGSIGDMWNLPFVMVVVRPTRFTFEFINEYPTFTVCAFSEANRNALNILGSKSGRDIDKIKESGITPIRSEKIAAPGYEESELVLECKKIYMDDFKPEYFYDKRIDKHYPLKDYHRMIFGEIVTVRGSVEKFT